MYWYGEGMGAGWYWLMAISWILFLALAVAGIVLLVRVFSRPGRGPGAPHWFRPPGPGYPGEQAPPAGWPGAPQPGPPAGAGPAGGPAPGGAPHGPPRYLTPEQVLADRYARGEIDDDEYQHRLANLRAATEGPEGTHR